jgi:hypothetical protein
MQFNVLMLYVRSQTGQVLHCFNGLCAQSNWPSVALFNGVCAQSNWPSAALF